MGVATVFGTDAQTPPGFAGRGIKQLYKNGKRTFVMNVLFYVKEVRMIFTCYWLYLKRTDNFFHGLVSMSIEIVIYTFRYFNCNCRINEICRTDLDG